MSEIGKIKRPILVNKALQCLGALQALAELLGISDFETQFTDPEGEAIYTISDLLSELVTGFSDGGDKK